MILIPNVAQQLTERFTAGGHPNRDYRMHVVAKNIGRSYGLVWHVVGRKVTPGSKREHRQPVTDIRLMPAPKAGKYTPHQGAREKARRVRQWTRGWAEAA